MTQDYRDRRTEARIRSAYEIAGARTMRLSQLRELTPDSRADLDRVLTRMALQDGVHVRGESDQKTLTDHDRAAAIILGGAARHTLYIEP
jgi:hypothetical protein